MSRIAVIGAGAWGTALAAVLGRKGTHSVRLWANEPEVCRSISEHRVNERFLPDFSLPAAIEPTNDFAHALAGAEVVVSVMPSQHCRSLFERMAPSLHPETLFVSCTKGLEDGSLLRMTEVIADVMRSRRFTPRLGALSGPSFAREVARGDPTAVTIASTDTDLARSVQHAFNDSRFRVYTNDDVIGVACRARALEQPAEHRLCSARLQRGDYMQDPHGSLRAQSANALKPCSSGVNARIPRQVPRLVVSA